MNIDWTQVRDFIYRRPVVAVAPGGVIGKPVTIPVAGSPDWVALDDDDPTKTAALVIAGSRWVLEETTAQIADRRTAEKDAAIEISQARQWSTVAQRIRDRDAALRSGGYIPRRAS